MVPLVLVDFPTCGVCTGMFEGVALVGGVWEGGTGSAEIAEDLLAGFFRSTR